MKEEIISKTKEALLIDFTAAVEMNTAENVFDTLKVEAAQAKTLSDYNDVALAESYISYLKVKEW